MIDLNNPLLDERGRSILTEMLAKRQSYLAQHRHLEAHAVAMCIVIAWRGFIRAQGDTPDSGHMKLEL
jgi:hypothetical protein